MDDLVLTTGRGGRPKRTGFALRHYKKSYVLVMPNGIYEDGDRLHFMALPEGFMVTLTPWGEKPMFKNGRCYVTTIPRAIAKRMMRAPHGVTELIFEERLNGTWFFPFSQFQPLQSTSGVLPVDDPTTLMEH
jgi:hypothetical protein